MLSIGIFIATTLWYILWIPSATGLIVPMVKKTPDIIKNKAGQAERLISATSLTGKSMCE